MTKNGLKNSGTKGVYCKYANIFIWGMKDPIIKPEHLAKFETGFPDSKTIKLEKSGHNPQEEEPVKVAEAIRNFMAE